jgi:hypothetical protein
MNNRIFGRRKRLARSFAASGDARVRRACHQRPKARRACRARAEGAAARAAGHAIWSDGRLGGSARVLRALLATGAVRRQARDWGCKRSHPLSAALLQGAEPQLQLRDVLVPPEQLCVARYHRLLQAAHPQPQCRQLLLEPPKQHAAQRGGLAQQRVKLKPRTVRPASASKSRAAPRKPRGGGHKPGTSCLALQQGAGPCETL